MVPVPVSSVGPPSPVGEVPLATQVLPFLVVPDPQVTSLPQLTTTTPNKPNAAPITVLRSAIVSSNCLAMLRVLVGECPLRDPVADGAVFCPAERPGENLLCVL